MKYAQLLLASSELCLAEISGHRLVDLAAARFQELNVRHPAAQSILLLSPDLAGAITFSGVTIEIEDWSSHSIATTLRPLVEHLEMVVLHDALRPLTSADQFAQVWDALNPEVDAARPSGPFVETLKAVSDEGFTTHTIDREKVRRVGTPEIIRTSAIEWNGAQPSISGWFLPLKEGSNVVNVHLDPQSSRASTEADLELLEILASESGEI